MDREVLTHINFDENCEYKASEILKKIAIPQQIVQIELQTPISIDPNSGEQQNIMYYDDRIQLTAIVFQEYQDNMGVTQKNFIQTGRVEFYFQPDDSTVPRLINQPTAEGINCEVNKNGTAAVIFKPRTSGTVYAKYIDDSDFYTAVSDINPDGVSNRENISLSKIPINVEFVGDYIPAYLPNVHDEVTLKVHITHGKDGTNVKYGTVTFMHYLVYDDMEVPTKRIPKIIGNPVPVINGYAEIKYIPVQTDDETTEPEQLEENGATRYVEYVRASYNYGGKYIDTDKEDYQWKYYDTSSKWVGIHVLARNSITIGTSLSVNESKPNIHQCNENQSITLTGVLKDKNDNIIDFNNHEGTFTFHIKGTHAHPKKSYIANLPNLNLDEAAQINEQYEFINYEKDIEATFSNNQFTAQIDKLLPGFYTITATTEIQLDKGNTLIDYEGPADIRNDKAYANISDSNIIYIMSNYIDIPDYRISLQHNNYYVKANSKVNNLIGNINGLSNKQKEILNNQTCEFYVAETNRTYIGKLKYQSSKLTAELDELQNDMIFNIAGNYTIQLYIPNGVYTNSPNTEIYHHNISSTAQDSVYDFYLPRVLSNPIIIQARESIELNLNIDTLSNIVPARLSYNLSGNRINTATNVDIVAKSTSTQNEQVLSSTTLYTSGDTSHNIVEINTAGIYEIYAVANDIFSNKITVDISKDSLSHSLLDSSKNIFAVAGNTMGIYLYSIGNNISSLDYSKLHFYIYDANQENRKEVSTQSRRVMDETTTYVIINANIETAGDWYLKVVYNGDNTFKEYNSDLELFKTELDTPNIKLIPNNNNYNIEITSTHIASKNDIVVAEVSFLNKNTEKATGLLLMQNSTLGSFYGYDENELVWWNEWDNIIFTFNPYNETLINILKNNEIPQNALVNEYDYIFDSAQVMNERTLYLQLQEHNNKYIYNTYKECEIRVQRPTRL